MADCASGYTITDMSARNTDHNGYIEVKGNPISKVGVFPYVGALIGAEDRDKVYMVYRPAEELSSQETIDSFKLVPFINEHAMLGAEDDGLTPAERKGVQGVIGEDVYYDAPYLRGNLRIFAETAKKLIGNGEKVELSPGYRCRYEFTPGVFDGEHYDAIQRDLRGNHLALVDEGRTGPDVKVLDSMRFTLDSNDLKEAFMADENKTVEAKATDMDDTQKAELRTVLIELLAELGIKPVVVDETPEEVKKASDAEVVEASAPVDEAKVKEEASEARGDADVAIEVLTDLKERVTEMEEAATGMDSKLFAALADRDVLAKKLSGFVGAFDSSAMTPQKVAEYGIKKLGIPAVKGHERMALDAWMHGRTPDHKKQLVGMDSKNGSEKNLANAWIKGE